jgi:peptidoglycan/LPS O-acetylase OafA/YrhL
LPNDPMNKQTKYMSQLDGLRFIAVSLVMFGHYTENYPGFAEVDRFLASSGVNLFFVLSGFLITRILITNNQESTGRVLRQFYVRRFLRIFPLYYAVLFGCYILNVFPAREQFPWFVTYASNYLTAHNHGSSGPLTHLWSLGVEEQFYIFFPFLVLLIPSRHHIKLFFSLLVLSVLSRGLIWFTAENKTTAWWMSYMYTSSCFDCFAAGAILAQLKVRGWLKGMLLRWQWFIAPLIFAIILYVYESLEPHNIFSMMGVRLFFSIFCFWLIGKASRGFHGWFGKFLNNNVVRYLGKISYGIYIFHNFMDYVASKIPLPVILYPVVTIGLAALSWHLYEKPINGLKRFFEYKAADSPSKPDNPSHSDELHHTSLRNQMES